MRNKTDDQELDRLLQESRDLLQDGDYDPSPANRRTYPERPVYTPSAEQPLTMAGARVRGRSRRGLKACLIVLLVLVLLVAAAGGVTLWLLNRGQTQEPVTLSTIFAQGSSLLGAVESPAEDSDNQTPVNYTRRQGVTTLLLAGADGDGLRTDTILLLFIDSNAKTLNLLSIPRDTLVPGDYTVPKINAAYGWVGGGTEGMEALCCRVGQLLGYEPDGYVYITLQTLIDAVDLMGGVEFDVPMDMVYSDPWQGLEINLKAGQQTLDGQQAMGLLRFRSGYATADLQRVQVQREFFQAALEQWTSLTKLPKLPKALALVQDQTVTTLGNNNLLWLAQTFLACDKNAIASETLPGTAAYIGGVSYYIADPTAVLTLVNERFNIYDQPIGWDMINIRTQ